MKIFQDGIGKHGPVLLILNNAKVRLDLDIINSIDQNFKVEFLPANTTSMIQPMDQGIKETMKQIYHKKLQENFSSESNKKSFETFLNNFNLKDCCIILASSFKYLTESNFQNGWMKLLGGCTMNTILKCEDESVTKSSLCNQTEEIKGTFYNIRYIYNQIII